MGGVWCTPTPPLAGSAAGGGCGVWSAPRGGLCNFRAEKKDILGIVFCVFCAIMYVVEGRNPHHNTGEQL
jgi:hypothetical protein